MAGRPLRVLALLDLVQDLDVLWPVLERLEGDRAARLLVVVSDWLKRAAPRVGRRLRAAGLAFRYAPRPLIQSGAAPALDQVDAVLTAAEGPDPAHLAGRAVTLRARAAGLFTAVLQHGLDNLETLAAAPDPAEALAAEVMFCWPPAPEIPARLRAALGGRLEAVGRPRITSPAAVDPPYDLAVFENLHAERYADADRAAVLEALLAFARARPDRRLLVRAHPAGGWLDRAGPAFAGLPHVAFVASAQARREDAADATQLAARTVTTPSTIALDAVEAGRPAALLLDGGPLYHPLPILRTLPDWSAFADAPPEPGSAGDAFAARHRAPGDAAGRIVARLLQSRENPVHEQPPGDKQG